jgi:DMSO reductase family type II enzyme chaperone
MSPEANPSNPAALTALTRSQLYALTAESFSEPPATPAEWEVRARELHAALQAVTSLPASEPVRRALAELRAATERFTDAGSLADLHSAYVELFGHLRAGPCPPYETEYTSSHDFVKNNDLADLMGFYRAFGLDLAGGERPDYIGVELEFLHVLALKEAIAHQQGKAEGVAVCLDAQKKFLSDHLGRWAEVFATQLSQLPADDSFAFYGALGRTLAALVDWDCARQGVKPERIHAGPRPSSPEPMPACESRCPADACKA